MHRTGVCIQGQACTTSLVTQRHCEHSRNEPASISRKGPTHCRNMRNRRGRRGNSLSTINVVMTRVSTPTTAETPTTNASAMMQIGSNSPSIPMTATLSMNGFRAIYDESAPFCRVCLEKSHCQAECPSIPNHLRQRFAAQRENNLNNLPPKSQ